MADEQVPSTEEVQQMTAISEAGAAAHQAGEDPAGAMKSERDRQGFVKLDDETIEKLADLLSDKSMEKLEIRGAFLPPPEPIRPPEQPIAPPAPGEEAAAAEESSTPVPAPKTTFAHRFLGQ